MTREEAGLYLTCLRGVKKEKNKYLVGTGMHRDESAYCLPWLPMDRQLGPYVLALYCALYIKGLFSFLYVCTGLRWVRGEHKCAGM